ncbi:hypothetical protein HKD37_19G053167 [Glycine soja]
MKGALGSNQPYGWRQQNNNAYSSPTNPSFIASSNNSYASPSNKVQVGQLAKQLSEHGSGFFSTNTLVNPKEQCKTITTRRAGTMVGLKDNGEKMNNEGVVEKNDEMVTSEKSGRESDKERHYKNFLDIFKRLQINIAFFEALEQMPTYAKFMKDLLTKNKIIMDDEIVEL